MNDLEKMTEEFEKLNKNFHTLKETADTARKEVKSLEVTSGENKQTIDRINKAMDANENSIKELKKSIDDQKELKGRLDGIELMLKRGGGTKSVGDDLSPQEKLAKGLYHQYLRKGITSSLEQLKDQLQTNGKEIKAMTMISDQDGGYFVVSSMDGRMVKRMYETSPMRQLATVNQIATDALEGYVDIDQVGVGWAGEEAARPATTTAKTGKWRIPVYEMYAKPQVSQILLEDASIDIEQFCAEKIGERFGRLEATAFIAGDGNNKPKGILAYPAGTAWGQVERVNSATTITSNAILDLIYKLKSYWRTGGSFLMTRTSMGIVRTIVDGQGRYMWAPGLEAGQPSVLAGYALHEANDMQEVALGVGALMVAFGNWREAYQIVDRIGMSILRDPYSAKPLVELYARRRVGGDVVNTEAYKLMVRT